MQYVLSESNKIYTGVTWSNAQGAKEIHEDGRPYHTFRTATVLVDANRNVFQNCVFENTAGPGDTAGQAIALYLDGDGIIIRNCVIRGHQDSLFLAPLPPKEIEKDGFLGPKQFTERVPRTFHFEKCRIEGDVDFVFGGATALFDECDFISNGPGYVFAPSTPENARYGFVARNCRFKRNGDVPDGSVYLGRPWREHAQLLIEDCWLDSHIHADGFCDWADRGKAGGVSFKELHSTGPGAAGRDRSL